MPDWFIGFLITYFFINFSNVNDRAIIDQVVDCILRKAEELLRVLQSKNTIKNLNDYSKAVFCLDLSASYLGIGFDKETAIKLSGFKRAVYQNKLHIVEKILELDKPLSISEVCVQFGCTAAKEFAERIFEKYKDQKFVTDITHPQYVAIAVYTACKLKKCKVQKSLFIGISRLKPSLWRELENEFSQFVDKLALPLESRKTTGHNEFYNYLEDIAKKNGDNSTSLGNKLMADHPEDYEVWKRRILHNARNNTS